MKVCTRLLKSPFPMAGWNFTKQTVQQSHHDCEQQFTKGKGAVTVGKVWSALSSNNSVNTATPWMLSRRESPAVCTLIITTCVDHIKPADTCWRDTVLGENHGEIKGDHHDHRILPSGTGVNSFCLQTVRQQFFITDFMTWNDICPTQILSESCQATITQAQIEGGQSVYL